MEQEAQQLAPLVAAAIKTFGTFAYHAYLTFLVALAVGFLFFLDRARQSRKQLDTLRGGLADVKRAVATLGMPPTGATLLDSSPMLSASATRADEGAAAAALSDEGLLTLLFDLYWTGRDGEAAFLWRKLPASRRQGLVLVAAPLGAYTSYLGGLAPQAPRDLDLAAYAAPFPTLHLDQTALRSLVEAEPDLEVVVTPVRRRTLGAVPPAVRSAPRSRMELGSRLLATPPSQLRHFHKVIP